MGSFVSTLIDQVNGVLWGWFMIVLLLATHLFLTIRTGVIQRYLGRGIRLSLRKSDPSQPGEVSHFSSLMVALSATIGVGNIVGVATAISLGGPGAVFWCWITGVLGISTKYAEAVLAVKYRRIDANGRVCGGPMYALERGVGSKWLAVLFCLFAAFASFGIGNMVQANTIAKVMQHAAGIPAWITGAVTLAVVALVVLGGVRSIAAVCRKLVPFMAIFYVIGCLVVLALSAEYIPDALALIGRSAFSAEAIGGGLLGAGWLHAMRYGIARGLFSNESGMGSAPIAAAAARTNEPAEQGLVSMTGTFWDTVVVCAITGLVIVTGLLKAPDAYLGLEGMQITYRAFQAIPWGEYVVAISLACFAFSTLLGWCYYGERCVEYLSGNRGIVLYRLLWVLVVFVGATTTLDVVWGFSDMANALMVLPNVVSLLVLHRVIRRQTDLYLSPLGRSKPRGGKNRQQALCMTSQK